MSMLSNIRLLALCVALAITPSLACAEDPEPVPDQAQSREVPKPEDVRPGARCFLIASAYAILEYFGLLEPLPAEPEPQPAPVDPADPAK